MNKDYLDIANKLKSKIHFNFNLGKLTWFRTGGNAKIFVIVENSEELEIILNEFCEYNFYILGSGSNLLIRDKGFNGVIIKLGKGFNYYELYDDCIEVGASILDINLSNFALKNNIEGFEFFSGIPGSVGGAIKMNAGCFGNETKDILKNVEIYNEKFEKKIVKMEDINLKYRSSNIKNSEIVTKAIFKTNIGENKEIKKKMDSIKKKRISSQPIKYKTSGSTFKNPKPLFAAKLIEEAGCKGLKYGDAMVSEKHANFLINNGNASAADLENLGKLVIDKVYKKFDLKLDWEIKIMGD